MLLYFFPPCILQQLIGILLHGRICSSPFFMYSVIYVNMDESMDIYSIGCELLLLLLLILLFKLFHIWILGTSSNRALHPLYILIFLIFLIEV